MGDFCWILENSSVRRNEHREINHISNSLTYDIYFLREIWSKKSNIFHLSDRMDYRKDDEDVGLKEVMEDFLVKVSSA